MSRSQLRSWDKQSGSEGRGRRDGRDTSKSIYLRACAPVHYINVMRSCQCNINNNTNNDNNNNHIANSVKYVFLLLLTIQETLRGLMEFPENNGMCIGKLRLASRIHRTGVYTDTRALRIQSQVVSKDKNRHPAMGGGHGEVCILYTYILCIYININK